MIMNRHFVRGVIAALASTTLAGLSLLAAPSLDVRKPPVLSGPNPNTGPAALDPIAQRGQWVIPAAGGAARVYSHEFHDNVNGQGGGVASWRAIYGRTASIVYAAGPGTAIIGFSVSATINNDTTTGAGGWQPGRNSHREQSYASFSYRGILYRPVLAAEFAVANPLLFPAGPVAGTPYTPSPGPRIIAANNDLRAWYCFNNVAPWGNYYVPTWEFPTINPGASATRILTFRVLDGGLVPADPRYAAIVNSLGTGRDLFSNRTTSLKISNWVEGLTIDTGAPYFQAGQGSDVSVFHLIPSTAP